MNADTDTRIAEEVEEIQRRSSASFQQPPGLVHRQVRPHDGVCDEAHGVRSVRLAHPAQQPGRRSGGLVESVALCRAAGSLRTSTRPISDEPAGLAFRVNAHIDAQTLLVESTSVECLFSMTPLPRGPPSPSMRRGRPTRVVKATARWSPSFRAWQNCSLRHVIGCHITQETRDQFVLMTGRETGLAETACHVIGCHLYQETTVQNACRCRGGLHRPVPTA